MKEKIKSSKRLQKLREEGEIIEKQKKEFLEGILNAAKPVFENYEKGYKVFSITHSHSCYFSLGDDMITGVINNLTDLYKCKLTSLSISQPPLSPKEYTLTFEK